MAKAAPPPLPLSGSLRPAPPPVFSCSPCSGCGGSSGSAVAEHNPQGSRGSASPAWNWLPTLRPLSVGGSGLPGDLGASVGCGLAGIRLKDQAWVSSACSSAGSPPPPVRYSSHSRSASRSNLSELPGGRRRSAERSREGGLQQSASDGVLLRRPSLRTAELLAGVSQLASVRNVRLNRQLSVLAHCPEPTVKPGRNRASILMPRASIHSSIFASLDEQGFTKATDRLATAITELKNGLENFDPRRPPSGKPTATAGRPGATGPSDDDRLEALAERLEAYKMARHVETELPPLSKTPLVELPPAPPPQQGIILRNASPEALQRFHPHLRQEWITRHRQERLIHQQDVAGKREQLLSQCCDRYSEVLVRKRQQGDVARSAKASTTVSSTTAERSFAPEKWVVLNVLVAFMSQIREDLVMAKMTYMDRMSYIQPDSPVHKRSSVAAQALDFSQRIRSHDQSLSTRFKLLQCVYKVRRGLEKARSDVLVVHAALGSWKVFGRCLLALRGLAAKVRKLQTWWRATARRLHEIRDKIFRRWERLERTELTLELGKFEPQKIPIKRLVAPQPRLALEDRVQLDMLPEAARVRFIEHELRARRYFVLPRIELWEKDQRRWHEELAKYMETKRVYEVLGIGDSVSPELTFSFPPMRPSYLPPGHSPSEEKGAPCLSGCLGRRGDQDILGWCRAARQHPHGGGWTEIPRRASGGTRQQRQSRQSSRRAASRGRSLQQPEQQTGLFGEAQADDLERWGIDLDDTTVVEPRPPSSSSES